MMEFKLEENEVNLLIKTGKTGGFLPETEEEKPILEMLNFLGFAVTLYDERYDIIRYQLTSAGVQALLFTGHLLPLAEDNSSQEERNHGD